MLDRLGQLVARAQRSSVAFAILFMDIDGFKGVNDTYGHEVGDLLLHAVAQRLTKTVRHSDTVARIGGDEFVIILETVRGNRSADAVALKVERSIAAPYLLQGHRLQITASIGISLYPENAEDADTLLRAADSAMYLAKREGGNRHETCPASKATRPSTESGTPDGAGLQPRTRRAESPASHRRTVS